MEDSLGHLSSSLQQCGLRRSLKVVGKEEVGCLARICVRGQCAASLGPGLGPLAMLLTVPEVQGERMLAFLADVPLDGERPCHRLWARVTPNLTPLWK